MAEAGIIGMIGTAIAPRTKALSTVPQRGGWQTIYEAFSGAWQRNIEVNVDSVLSNHAVFSCQTLIASDISKLRIKLSTLTNDMIWEEVQNFSYPVLNRPNRFQTRQQFMESWVLSKLQYGNTYVLLERGLNEVGVERVNAMYVLDPKLVRPMVSDSGDVYYQLTTDKIVGVGEEQIVVPAREIIHDRFNTFFHPLVGLSPIFANGLSATQALSIQNNSTLFFQNGSMPGGIITVPGAISDETAVRLKTAWDTNYSGVNAGKVAVLADGMTFSASTVRAVDSQLIEQLKWSAEVICGTYHVPPYKIGIGTPPNGTTETLNLEYYTTCLQSLIEAIEELLDYALGIRGLGNTGPNLGTELDIDALLRMDMAAQYDVAQKAKGILTLDETRRKVGVGKVAFGDTIYLQQQDHSLASIAARDAMLIAEANEPPPPATPPAEGPAALDDNQLETQANAALIEIMKGLR